MEVVECHYSIVAPWHSGTLREILGFLDISHCKTMALYIYTRHSGILCGLQNARMPECQQQ